MVDMAILQAGFITTTPEICIPRLPQFTSGPGGERWRDPRDVVSAWPEVFQACSSLQPAPSHLTSRPCEPG